MILYKERIASGHIRVGVVWCTEKRFRNEDRENVFVTYKYVLCLILIIRLSHRNTLLVSENGAFAPDIQQFFITLLY